VIIPKNLTPSQRESLRRATEGLDLS
jgi:hypothetical protein